MAVEMIPYITRIAPSPTGDMHLGTVRTGYLCWLAAKASGGTSILRIDDTDQERNKPEYIDIIFDTMKWLNLDWDITFRQSDRLERYQEVAELLLQSGKASRIEGGAVVLKYDDQMPKSWIDDISGEIKITDRDVEKDLSYLILIRSDQKPTYHFATVIDDMDYNVNWVIRGVDHISNTAKHLAIYHALGKPLPKHSHVGLLFGDGKKLSKRDGSASALSFQKEGYHPEALLNFLLKNGWSTKVDSSKADNIWPREKAIAGFLTQGKMKNQKSSLDLNKLKWLDGLYKSGSYLRYLSDAQKF